MKFLPVLRGRVQRNHGTGKIRIHVLILQQEKKVRFAGIFRRTPAIVGLIIVNSCHLRS